MKILGIETSCDETAVAIVNDDANPGARILGGLLHSQIDTHQPFGGVVPEVAARAHLQYLDGLVARCLADAELDFSDLDGIAATGGPGLIGGVIVGVMTAKAIAAVTGLPFVAVNHLEAHALTARLTDDVAFPYLLLLVSGGHCQFLIVEGVGRYRRLGTTIDDALGEAFDKTAKMLGMGYPGGPAVEAAARSGISGRFTLPRPLKGRPGCHFSFSGLKTAVRQTIEKCPPGPLSDQDIADLCRAFQEAAADVLQDRLNHAIDAFRAAYPSGDTLVVAGGVAANAYLRARLDAAAADHAMKLVAPPPALCTDNGVMVAWAGLERLREGWQDKLDFTPRPRWPLDPDAPKVGLGGRKA